ncbi:hypothetical protein Tco_1266644, partial [Tanacetum coccineum]
NNEYDSRSEGSDQERDSGDDKAQSDSEKGSDSEHETDENESGSKSDQEENEEDVEDDEEDKDDELVKTPSNSTNDEEETNVKDKAESGDNKGMDYTINQLDDDENKTKVPVTSSSHSPDLASKFLNLSDIPHTDAHIVSPMDVHVHHEILPKEVSNFAPLVIQSMVTESLEHAVLAKDSSQPKSTYEAASSLTEFELKKILINKIDEMYSLKKSQKDKEKDEDPSAGSDRELKKRKTSKDAELTKGPKAKESQSGSSKGAKSQSKSSGKSIQSEEPEFEVADSDIPQDQEENLEPIDPDWNDGKTLQQRPTQSWLMTLASYADKPLKTFDELMSTPIDFSAYIMNGLKITNLTQETLLGPAFKLLKGIRSNYA